MAYEAANPVQCMLSGVSGGPSIWHYLDGDAHGDVDATDYFTLGRQLGMKLGDIVFVVNSTGYTTTVHAVSAIDSDGNVTVSAAVLA